MARALTSLTLIQIRFNINACNAEVHGTEGWDYLFAPSKNLIEHISAFSSTNKIYWMTTFWTQKNTMSNYFRIPLAVAVSLCIISLAGISTSVSLLPAWKEPRVAGGSFFDVMFSSDGSRIYAGGNQMLVRSWDGTSDWGGGTEPLPICVQMEITWSLRPENWSRFLTGMAASIGSGVWVPPSVQSPFPLCFFNCICWWARRYPFMEDKWWKLGPEP